MKFQDEIEWMGRRRSSRIIALEEKKLKERERKLALALERKNKSMNHDKQKGKATIEVQDDLRDFSEHEEGSTKKGHKSKEFYQLISSIKELERHSENVSTSGSNDSSLNGVSLKNILQIIIDFLQREDPNELLAQPISFDVVENYYEIVKQPMDFGTIRAKIHESLYTNLEQFKRDVFLMLSNATDVYPTTSKYHQVAENISRDAKCVFEALAEPQNFDSELSLDKTCPTRKPQNGKLGTSRRVSPKVASMETRSSFNLHLKTNSIKYKESLLRFVQDLGPTAKRVAAKKLEALRDQQLCNVDTPTPQTQPTVLNAQTLALAIPFLNRSLTTIPGSAAQGNKIFNNNNVGGVNIKDVPYQGNKTNTNDSWNAYVATLLSNRFLNNDKGESSSGRIENFNTLSPRVYPTTSVISGPSISLPESSSLVPQSRIRNFMSSMPSNNLSQISHAHKPRPEDIINLSDLSLVSQQRPENFISYMPSNNLSQISHAHKPRPEDIINLSDLSLVSQQRPENFISYMPSNNLKQISLTQEPNNLSQFSRAHEPRPEDIINLSDLSLVSKARPENFVSCMPCNNLKQFSLAREPRPEDFVNLSDLSLVSQPRPRDSMYAMPSNNSIDPSLMPRPWQANSMYCLNSTSVSPLPLPNQGMSVSSTSDSSSMNHSTSTMLHGIHDQVLHNATPYTPFDMQVQNQYSSYFQLDETSGGWRQRL
ncbi:hypothetical protein JHK82_031848 [Glycine max]|nr:hypothetical protein JHK85_032507 [Glycine max]KAG4995114.1 hypothetical protein JHK86_031941 [Glycine max]KAG5125111.1 hypothetical protein JHK82_031848 [Glycine max]KAG5146539.1 hypothetical protein JHK84_032082 [Glycine max]